MTLVLPISAAVTLIGVLLLWLGVRGRRVDDHPICRKCGFDLFGRPPDSERCPECGADVTRPRATRVGRRVRRGRVIAIGVFALAIGLCGAAGGGYAKYRGTDWQAKKPVWWLVREMRSNSPATRDAALAEASRRLMAARLAHNPRRISQAEVDRIVDHVLSSQADASTPWLTSLGNFVEQARLQDMVSPDRWRRYAEQAVRLELSVRPRVRRGDPIPYVVRVVERRIGRSGLVLPQCEALDRLVDGQPVGAGPTLQTHGDSVASVIEPEEYLVRVSEGSRNLAVKVRFDVSEIKREMFSPRLSTIAKPVIALSKQFELLPSDRASVRAVRDAQYAERMQEPIVNASATFRPLYESRRITVTFACDPLPVGIGYDVLLWNGQYWRPLGTIACPANTSRQWRMSCEDRASGPVSLLFEPSVAAAARSVDTEEIWEGGGPITITGLTPPAPATTTSVPTSSR